MVIRSLKLIDYRNYTHQEVSFSAGINVITGENAQGKTNLVEAVVLSCIGRSPRTPRDKELIRWNAPHAYVCCTGERKYGKVKVETFLTHTENKRISINGLPIRKLGELMGNLNAVYFTPDELKIVKSGPGERRRFLDIDISQLSKTYFYELSRYNRILSQRNKLLKTGHATVDTLSIWDVQLASVGARIIRQRKEYVKRLARLGCEAHAYLTDGKERLAIAYEGLRGDTEQEIEQAFLSALEQSRERDLRLQYTTQGLHKDDLALTIDGVDIRSFGSQGQQRTAALAMKLAELEIFHEILDEYPVLILDDVLSELDPVRQAKLLDHAHGVQTLITCTTAVERIQGAHTLTVRDGVVTAE